MARTIKFETAELRLLLGLTDAGFGFAIFDDLRYVSNGINTQSSVLTLFSPRVWLSARSSTFVASGSRCHPHFLSFAFAFRTLGAIHLGTVSNHVSLRRARILLLGGSVFADV